MTGSRAAAVVRRARVEGAIVAAAVRFVGGGARRPAPAGFTYHRQSGLRLLLPVLPLLALGDVLLLELVVLPQATPVVKAVVHALGIWVVVRLVGVYATMKERPHRLEGDVLTLHRGILGSVAIPIDAIESIAPLPSFADGWKERAYRKGALRLEVDGGSVLELRVRAGAAPATRVLIGVDEPEALIAAIR